jgi:hypothetical protein
LFANFSAFDSAIMFSDDATKLSAFYTSNFDTQYSTIKSSFVSAIEAAEFTTIKTTVKAT